MRGGRDSRVGEVVADTVHEIVQMWRERHGTRADPGE